MGFRPTLALVTVLVLSWPLPIKTSVLWPDVCTQPDVKGSDWCDTSKPAVDRAKAFVAALVLSEKIGIMTNEAKGVPRLHIPPYQWGSEG